MLPIQFYAVCCGITSGLTASCHDAFGTCICRLPIERCWTHATSASIELALPLTTGTNEQPFCDKSVIVLGAGETIGKPVSKNPKSSEISGEYGRSNCTSGSWASQGDCFPMQIMMYGEACSCALTCRAAINQRSRTYQYTTTRMNSRDEWHTGTSCRVSLSMPSQDIARRSRALDMGRLSYDRTHFLFCLVLFKSRVNFLECRTNRGVLRVVDVYRVERFRVFGGGTTSLSSEAPLRV
jgi:hypothetical protein